MMKLIDYNNPSSLAYWFRKRRMKWLFQLVFHVVQKHSLKEVTICDIGGTESYWTMFPFWKFNDVSFHLSIINLRYPEYDHNIKLPDNVTVQKLIGNSCDLCNIKDSHFNISHSNSVIEHVGMGQKTEKMASELLRVSEYYFLQTPNFWFPIEPHFLIPFYALFPRPIRVWLQLKIKKEPDLRTAIRMDDSVRLLTRREVLALFPNGEIIIERFILFSKSIIVRSRIF